MMTPMGQLMIEHRLIERMVRLLAVHGEGIAAGDAPDSGFIGAAVDFIHTYADRCHHGKEEDILFADLADRPLEEPYARILSELIAEHVHARAVTRQLVEANERWDRGDKTALQGISSAVAELALFYPRHIEKEDRHFFVPVIDCFTKEELATMLDRFHQFDRQLIYDHYRDVVGQFEAARLSPGT